MVIEAGEHALKSRFDDADWPFEPLPMFEWLAPLAWPSAALEIEAGRSPKLWVVEQDSYWEKPPDGAWELLEAGLEVVRGVQAADIAARQALPRTIVISERGAKEEAPSSFIDQLNGLRLRKSAFEVACLDHASEVAARGHKAAESAFRSGERSELMLHLAYLRAAELDDSQCPYRSIVALGPSGAVLHHVQRDVRPNARSFLLDAGGRHLAWCSDVTRTHVVAGDDLASVTFASLIEAMDRLQLQVVSEIRRGVDFEALHDSAHHKLGVLLHEAGLVTCSAEESVEAGITRAFFPHGLGHHLGVQVHDVGGKPRPPRADNPFLRNTRAVEVGHVMTIEPGLYVIDALLEPHRASGAPVDWRLVDELRPFGGIRIEDDVLMDGEATAAS
ncbi:MAG: M24 family metallopeptidase [Myxococcales bacterium]|nr:M24 family metallopeptidase [Myxococcales bacterium]